MGKVVCKVTGLPITGVIVSADRVCLCPGEVCPFERRDGWMTDREVVRDLLESNSEPDSLGG